MKYDDFMILSDLEKVSLTGEQIEDIIRYEACANGFMGLQEPHPYQKLDLDEKFYKCFHLHSKNEALIETFCQFLRDNKDELYETSYMNYRIVLQPLSDYQRKVAAEYSITEENYHRYEDELKIHNRTEKIYKTELENYNLDQKIWDTEKEPIITEIIAAQDRIRKRISLKKSWEMYLETAKGDEEIARAFWQKAYGEVEIPV